MAKLLRVLITATLLLVFSTAALAVDATAPLTVNTSISARASLTLGSNTINFPDADPSATPLVAATENPISVTARVRTGSSSVASLQVLAGGDLASGVNFIDVANVTWSATGAGFTGGAMNKTTAQPAGSWTGSGERTGSFSYNLANSWDYFTGNYSVTVTYTLSAP